MRFFPSITEQFHSPLTPEQVAQQLRANLSPEFSWKDLFAAKSSAPFLGEVGNGSFAIQRVISYRNSWLPQIKGLVQPAISGPGSMIEVRHQLHPFVLVFTLCWLAATGLSAFTSLSLLLANRNFSFAALIPLGMFAFGLVLFTVPFWLEVRKSRPLLVQLLQLTETTSQRPHPTF